MHQMYRKLQSRMYTRGYEHMVLRFTSTICLCIQCLSPFKFDLRTWWGVFDTTLCNQCCHHSSLIPGHGEVYSIHYVFSDCHHLSLIPGHGEVYSIHYVFSDCHHSSLIPGHGEVYSIHYVFSDCHHLSLIPGHGEVYSIHYVFSDCHHLSLIRAEVYSIQHYVISSLPQVSGFP